MPKIFHYKKFRTQKLFVFNFSDTLIFKIFLQKQKINYRNKLFFEKEF